jgi:hypothetical protein
MKKLVSFVLPKHVPSPKKRTEILTDKQDNPKKNAT